MTHRSPEPSEDDTTLAMLETVVDGSLTGLASYHLLKLQLFSIRNLPERDERDRNPPPR
jgi:hypothetical protein